MKKNYFMLAAAALMFAACAQFDTVNEVPESEPQAIGFDTYAQLPTRATENNNGTYNDALKLHHDDFAVWAFKNTSTVPVFGADPTTDPTAGTTVSAEDYSYGPLKYWDKTANNYYFYAAAPATTNPKWTLNGVTDIASQANGYFTISDVILQASNFRTTPNATPTTTFKSADKDKDLMIAAPNEDIFTAVELEFIHILSRLNIIVKKETGLTPDPTITLNSVKVYGINLKGSFDESAAAATTAGSIARWTPAATPVTTSQYAYTTNLALTTDDQYIIESLVIPQNVDFEPIETDGTTVETKPYLEVIYTINGEQYKAYYNLAATFGKTTGQSLPFNEGWQNTLTITISPASITFAGNVSTWSETPGAQPID